MSHYSTLRDYRFEDDVDDIRGATLYGEGGTKLARLDDIVLDHDTGDINYFVADTGHDRRVLVPLERVFRAVVDEDSFHSDLSPDDLAHLPAFDEKMLHNRDEWKIYQKLHGSAMEDIRRCSLQEYQREFEDTPVEHIRDDVAHTITPIEPVPAGSRSRFKVTSIEEGRRRHDDYVPDLTPHRIAPVFTSTAPSSVTMVPQAESSRGLGAEYISIGLEPRWQGYQERIRRNLANIRRGCKECTGRNRRIAS